VQSWAPWADRSLIGVVNFGRRAVCAARCSRLADERVLPRRMQQLVTADSPERTARKEIGKDESHGIGFARCMN
jgi:hypothetical protein